MSKPVGIFIDPDTGLLGVAGAGHVIKIGMSPNEMRALGEELFATAGKMEQRAAAAADAAILKARGTLQ